MQRRRPGQLPRGDIGDGACAKKGVRRNVRLKRSQNLHRARGIHRDFDQANPHLKKMLNAADRIDL